MTDLIDVELAVNGTTWRGPVEPRLTLADLLRTRLGLTGTHLGCEQGVCGACTVLVDGEAVRSCLLFAVQVRGADVRTVEGLAEADGTLHPVQEGFWRCTSFQCGFCAPGFAMVAAELLATTPDPSEEEIRGKLSGNLCRCTGYQSIVDGVREAARVAAARNAELQGGSPH